MPQFCLEGSREAISQSFGDSWWHPPSEEERGIASQRVCTQRNAEKPLGTGISIDTDFTQDVLRPKCFVCRDVFRMLLSQVHWDCRLSMRPDDLPALGLVAPQDWVPGFIIIIVSLAHLRASDISWPSPWSYPPSSGPSHGAFGELRGASSSDFQHWR